MAIYRGAGGSGDAIVDTTSASAVAVTAANAALDSAIAAAASASTASTAASSTAGSVAAAAVSETNAAASAASSAASAASSAASAASSTTSADSASSSASAAAASYDSFDDRYLGAKASDPALDNDGNALLTGALYFDSVNSAMKAYTGSAWLSLATSAGFATLDTPQTYIAAQRGEVTALTDAVNITSDFNDSNFFSVTLGGNRTLNNPSNLVAGQSGSIFITQDATGSRTLAFGSYWDFAGGTVPTLSIGANVVDRLDYVVRTSTSIHAVLSKAWS